MIRLRTLIPGSGFICSTDGIDSGLAPEIAYFKLQEHDNKPEFAHVEDWFIKGTAYVYSSLESFILFDADTFHREEPSFDGRYILRSVTLVYPIHHRRSLTDKLITQTRNRRIPLPSLPPNLRPNLPPPRLVHLPIHPTLL